MYIWIHFLQIVTLFLITSLALEKLNTQQATLKTMYSVINVMGTSKCILAVLLVVFLYFNKAFDTVKSLFDTK